MILSLDIFIQSHSIHYILLGDAFGLVWFFFFVMCICDRDNIASYYITVKVTLKGLIRVVRVTANTSSYEALHPGIITKSV